LRCDANISLRPLGQKEYGTRSEIKNMNSFRAVQRGLEYEELRQAQILDEGGEIARETRTWDEEKGVTRSMRSKEEAHDYRYFPEPDLVPFVVEQDWVEAVKAQMPELPDRRKARLTDGLGLSDYDAAGVISNLAMANYFDEAMKHTTDAKAVANWLLGDVSAWLNAHNLEMADLPLPAQNLAGMIGLINKGTISSKLAKAVFEEMISSGKPPEEIVKEKGLEQISDTDALAALADKIIAQNPKSAEDYKAGKDRALGFLVGQIMKESKGKANPEMINQLLRDKLGKS